MGFFRRLLYLISIAGIVYAGIQINITEQTLVQSLVPFLVLWVMVDVPHFLTLGMLDLSNALFVIFKRTSISLPDNYRGFVLPIDVDDSGMMKQVYESYRYPNSFPFPHSLTRPRLHSNYVFTFDSILTHSQNRINM